MIIALREYADDWQVRLHDAPGHRENRGLIYAIGLIDDAKLREWLVESGRVRKGEPEAVDL
ncbi:hypothetical protein [Nocardia barduliensis]|uniref:hypothetical protein n=1 Tax=Nocardia barduliensis TaxID=2736643 RepID=UPI00157192AE|nr:hypothetical protein [Nocardia barduliensis]